MITLSRLAFFAMATSVACTADKPVDTAGTVSDTGSGCAEPQVFNADLDGDGYGDPDTSVNTCSAPSGYVADSSDCDDSSASIHPGASEVCDGVDDDCNGLVDDDDPGVTGTSTWYADADSDGYGDASASATGCSQPTGFVSDTTDCDDTDPGASPAALEICGNDVDEDCDGNANACRISGTMSLSSAGAKLVGEEAYDDAGVSVSGAGDVDGDGHADVLVGAPGQDAGGADPGAAYLVLGPVSGTLDLSAADAKFVGEADGDWAGWSVSDAGDVDGDGYDDMLVGAESNYIYVGGTSAGAAYLVLGPASGTLDLSAADAKFVGGAAGDLAGRSVSGAGDIDGDGHDDMLVGVPYDDAGGTQSGAAYLVFGPASGTIDPSTADAEFVGEGANNLAGMSVSGAGDVDGDGQADLVIGANYQGGGGTQSGAAYLVLGPASGTMNLSAADAKLVGELGYDHAGQSVSGAGDVDGDGYDDLVIGAPSEDSSGVDAGAVYLVRGSVGSLDLSAADAKLVGEAAGDEAGSSVSGVGDIDGDGHDDLMVGTIREGSAGTSAGAAYLVLGPVTGTINLSAADAKLMGEMGGDEAGFSVSGAGDVDGDGHDDVLVGAAYQDAGGTQAGAAYLLYGGGI